MSQKGKALKTNKLRVLGEICSGQHVTRTELAEAIGMTPMSVSTIVRELRESDILVEVAGNKKETQLGRKPQILDLSPKCPCVLAMNLSRQTLQIAVMDLRADVRKEWHRDVPYCRSADELREFIYESVDSVTEGLECRIAGIGLCTLGPVNTEKGVILSPKRFHELGDIYLKDPLSERYGVPVIMVHDASSCALAESRLGHHDADSLIYILLTSGIGCGIVYNGQVFGGENGLAGELGNCRISMTGPDGTPGKGCLEYFVSIPELTEEINRKHGFVPRLSWHEIVSRYNEGDDTAAEEFEKAAEYLAAAITSVANLLDISTFVLEYEGQECGDRLERLTERKVRETMLVPNEKKLRILKSTFGPLSGVIGACSAVVSEIVKGNIEILD